MTTENIVCKKCILHEGFLGLSLNSEGLCQFCTNPNHKNPNWSKVQIDDALRKRCLEDWEKTLRCIQENKGKHEYDCIIGYSGGKDSTGLLDTLVNEYGLNPLCVTIDTGFMTEVAKNNIKKTLSKMNLNNNFVLIEDAIQVFRKLYKHLFLNHRSNEKTLTADICPTCTNLIHTVLVIEAMKRHIGYIIIGYSSDQIAHYFYETKKEDIIKDGGCPADLKQGLTANDLRWFLDSNNLNIESIPRILYPYHVIPYNEAEIIKRIEEKQLIESGKGDPVLTNCHVVKASLVFDLYRFGGLTYALQYAELVRQETNAEEQRKARKKWLRTINQVSRAIFNGTFDNEGITEFFQKVNISKDQMMEAIEYYRENDSNKAQIIRSIQSIQERRLK